MELGTTKLTKDQAEEQLQTILHFLNTVHPNLLETQGYRPSVEIRPILRVPTDPKDKDAFALKLSLSIWDLEERSLERLRKFLERHNGSPACLFYSVFDYDNNIEVKKTNGTYGKSVKITSAAALGTQEIALDFDHIDFDDYTQLIDRFEDIGLSAMWVFSGHGYQAHILLDQRMSDKNALRKMVYKFRSKGFDCDAACIDPARVMRLPGTYNLKCLKDEAYAHERENPPLCAIVRDTEERYSLEEIFDKLDTLPTVNVEDEVACGNTEEVLSEEDMDLPFDGIDDASNVVHMKRVEYPYLSEFELADPVRQMLTETPYGYRNKVLGFLIRHFTKEYRLGRHEIFEIMSIWAKEACVPAYDPDDFKTDFRRLYYVYQGLKYDSALARQFGALDTEDLIRIRQQDIHIPNKFFRDFDKLDGKTVRLYLGIKLLEHMEEDSTQERLSELLGISTRALRPTLQDLIKSGHGYMTPGNARMKIPSTYHTSRIVSAHDGYMKLSYNDVNCYVNDLYIKGSRGNGELKLYLFMRYKFYKGDVWMSQANMGSNIGVARTTISGLVNRLEERKFLRIRKVMRRNGLQSAEYHLLR